VKLINATKAAIKAKYSENSARQIGHENLTKPYIQQRIKQIQNELKMKLGIDDSKVLSELASLAYWNIQDFIANGNSIKDLSKIPKAKIKPVVGIKTTEKTITIGETTEVIKTTELKFVDKRGSLGDRGRHLGIFEKCNAQRQAVLPTTLQIEVIQPKEED
jgi:phage terminase small subunit